LEKSLLRIFEVRAQRVQCREQKEEKRSDEKAASGETPHTGLPDQVHAHFYGKFSPKSRVAFGAGAKRIAPICKNPLTQRRQVAKARPEGLPESSRRLNPRNLRNRIKKNSTPEWVQGKSPRQPQRSGAVYLHHEDSEWNVGALSSHRLQKRADGQPSGIRT